MTRVRCSSKRSSCAEEGGSPAAADVVAPLALAFPFLSFAMVTSGGYTAVRNNERIGWNCLKAVYNRACNCLKHESKS